MRERLKCSSQRGCSPWYIERLNNCLDLEPQRKGTHQDPQLSFWRHALQRPSCVCTSGHRQGGMEPRFQTGRFGGSRTARE